MLLRMRIILTSVIEMVNEDFSKSQFATLNVNGDKRGTNVKKLCAINKIENTEMIHPVIASLLLGADKVI